MTDKKISELTALTAAELAVNDVIPVVDTSEGQTKKIAISELDARYHMLTLLDFTTDQNSKNDVHGLHGGLNHTIIGDTLANGDSINMTTGISRILLALLVGADFVGSITVTGTTVDRDTGVETPADSEVLTIDALTTDASAVDSAGETVHDLIGAYATTKRFKGAVVISTLDVNISNIDIYQMSFEQFDSHSNITIKSFDIQFDVTNATAFFTGHLYTIIVAEGKTTVASIADLELLAADSNTSFYRLRRGKLDILIDGTTSGVFMDLFFKPDNQTYFDSIACKVWARISPLI